MIRLRNTAKHAQTFNLTTDVAPVRALYPRRKVHKDGDVEDRDVRVVHPASITILAGEVSEPLHDAAVKAPEIAAAIRARRLVVEAVQAADEVADEAEQSSQA